MNAKSALAAAIAALLLSVAVSDAKADNKTYTSRGQRPTTEGDDSSEAQPASRKGDQKETFPKATRPDPGGKVGKMGSKLNKIGDFHNDQKYDQAQALADEVIADPKANAYERAQAARIAGASAEMTAGDDYAHAIEYYKRALSENSLSNSDHYWVMRRVATLYMQDQKYTEGLALADQFLAETQADDKDIQLARGDAYYQMERYPEAIDALKKAIPTDGAPQQALIDRLFNSYIGAEQAAAGVPIFEALAAKRPNDVRSQLDLARMYGEAGMPDKAVGVFQRLKAAGQLTKAEDYARGAELLAEMENRENDTIAFIQAGYDSGVLKPDPHMYALLGQSYYFTERFAEAAAAYEKGAALAKDGELYYNVSSSYGQIEQWAKAKAAAQQALAKGMRTPGNAWMMIAAAEDGLGNPAGRLAAYREAAKDPKTRDQANKMIKALGGK
jgi:tetratricopeptide (TPR) repeat protein